MHLCYASCYCDQKYIYLELFEAYIYTYIFLLRNTVLKTKLNVVLTVKLTRHQGGVIDRAYQQRTFIFYVSAPSITDSLLYKIVDTLDKNVSRHRDAI